jgi:hypothetical protein
MHFWTPRSRPLTARLGIACHGFVTVDGAVAVDRPGHAAWPVGEGAQVVSGEADAVIAGLGRITAPTALVVLAARAAGVEPILAAVQARFPGVPTVGGGACRLAGGAVADQGESADGAPFSVIALTHGRWAAETLVVHGVTGPTMAVEADGPRRILRLRVADDVWRPAREVFAAWQRSHRREPGDFASVTVADRDGRTLHLSADGEALRCGSDLPADGRLVLRAGRADAILAQVQAFADAPGALVIGCAGLAGLLPATPRPAPGALLAFLWGEIGPIAGQPRFANLLCTRLRPA